LFIFFQALAKKWLFWFFERWLECRKKPNVPFAGRLFTLSDNGYVYETFGISKHCPVKLQLLLIRAETLDKPLTAKCFIYDVVCCPSFILFCLSFIYYLFLSCVGLEALLQFLVWLCVFGKTANVLPNAMAILRF